MTRRVVVGACVVVAIVAAAMFALRRPSEQPYYDLVARLKAAGEPVDFDGVAPKRVSDDENGAADLRAALRWLDDNLTEDDWKAPGPWNSSTTDDWRQTTPPERWEELAGLVEKMAPFLDRVRAATEKPRIQFLDEPRDATGFPCGDHVRMIQRVQRVLVGAAAGGREEQRRLDAACLLAALSDRLDGATVIDHAVGTGGVTSAIDAARRESENGRADPVAWRARLDPWLQERWLASAPQLVRETRAFLLQAHRAARDSGWPSPPRPWYARLWPGLRTKSAPVSPFDLEAMERYLASVDHVVRECDDLARVLEVPLGEFRSYRASIAAVVGDSAKTQPELGSVRMQIDRLGKLDAQSRLARVALAVCEFRVRRGDFPTSFDDLRAMFPNGIPRDPYSDAPFVYEKTATDARIASVGRLPEEKPLDAATLRERCLVWELKR